MTSTFVHLHLHTEFSLLDGIVRIKPLMQTLIDEKMPACAMTDQANLFALVKYYTAAMGTGIKPIIGSEVYLENPDDRNKPFCLVLLCQDQTGYHHLSLLLSQAYTENQHHGKAMIKREWLEGQTQGLIALSAGMRGDIGQALINEDTALAEKCLTQWLALFPDRFYIELTRTGRPNEKRYVQSALELALKHQAPVVATNDVRFLQKDDFEAHEARVCIHDSEILNNAKRVRRYSEEQYLKTPAQMIALFEDVPEAITNAVEIAKRCNLTLTLGKSSLPNFPVPPELSVEQYLAQAAEKGLEKRLAILFDPNNPEFKTQRKPYDDRLKRELAVINQMGFPGYFLIVADFIHWAKNNGVPVGPGRGSGAGSIVAYALDITDLDPLSYDLLFERFLNPERVSMPDFDIDFCMEGRDRVIDYVAKKYGRKSVSQIITFGTMAAKAVVRDVGRILDHPYNFVDKIAKLIPFELGITLEKALEEPALKERYEQEEDVRTVIDLARKLEGIARNAGKHAGGVVISPGVLTDFAPVYCEQDSEQIVTQLDKDDVEAIGLVKFDFLGLRTLTIINWALQTINQKNESPINISLIPLDDKATFKLLKACQTTAVFQLESRGMRDLMKRLKPDSFEEIIALVALFRPGPLQSGMVDDFINRKHGRAEVTYPHPDLKPILQPTYGVILYQEQVMQIAQVLAGYSLGAADILRRAMGKKKPAEMAKQREIFVSGAEKNKINKKTAERIFDLMEKFAGYGFNKSHSAAYALIAYQTAWLKAHYPAEFMAAVLSSDMDNTDKVVIFIEECAHMGLNVLPPDINQGQYKFTVDHDSNIIYGLGAIKGAGESALESIFEIRKNAGPFKSLYHFCQCVVSRKITKRILEALIKSGTMDKLGPHRATMIHSLKKILHAVLQHEKNKAANQVDLFGNLENDEKDHLEPDLVNVACWPSLAKLRFEKEALGFYLSGHPFDEAAKDIRPFTSTTLANIANHVDGSVSVAGLITGIRMIKTKRGKRMGIITLDDHSARVDAVLFSEILETARELIQPDHILFIEGDVSVDDFSGGHRLTVKNVLTQEQARIKHARRLQLQLNKKALTEKTIQQLVHILKHHAGPLPVSAVYKNEQASVKLPFGRNWKIYPSDALFQQLRALLPTEDVVLL
jgi:DNA polymerase III subunit alpha